MRTIVGAMVFISSLNVCTACSSRVMRAELLERGWLNRGVNFSPSGGASWRKVSIAVGTGVMVETCCCGVGGGGGVTLVSVEPPLLEQAVTESKSPLQRKAIRAYRGRRKSIPRATTSPETWLRRIHLIRKDCPLIYHVSSYPTCYRKEAVEKVNIN